jgi:molybdopterin synthase sulfur carrier subunit
MKVNFYGLLRKLSGQKTVEYRLIEGTTVWQLMDTVAARFPEIGKRMVVENGVLYPHGHILVNGRDYPFLENGMDTILRPGDKVDMFPPGHF